MRYGISEIPFNRTDWLHLRTTELLLGSLRELYTHFNRYQTAVAISPMHRQSEIAMPVRRHMGLVEKWWRPLQIGPF